MIHCTSSDAIFCLARFLFSYANRWYVQRKLIRIFLETVIKELEMVVIFVGFMKNNKMARHFLALVIIIILVEHDVSESCRLENMLELFFFVAQHLVSDP